MKVYKFGGASVRDAAGVRNLAAIAAAEPEPLFIVVSAMGKTTNALEKVLDNFWEGRTNEAVKGVRALRDYHEAVCSGIFGVEGVPNAALNGTASHLPAQAAAFINELEQTVLNGRGDVQADVASSTFDYWYDRLVSFGELISTSIVAAATGARWLDARTCFATDGRHRDADVDLEETAKRLHSQMGEKATMTVCQGFIGANAKGETTTLGREGSDYSAAVAAYVLGAESLTIWKDVPGVMNADPKFFQNAVFIPELSYIDAIELAYSGAQIIHPKTIKPLQNHNIPLFVRPFGSPASTGTKIWEGAPRPIGVPVLILKGRQTLLTVRPRDFSFVMEQRLHEIFSLLNLHGLKPNLIQSSAISLSMCVDESRNMPHVVDRLIEEGFSVSWNEDMELLTIRGYTPSLFDKYSADAFLLQKTRRVMRVVRKK